MDNTIILLIDFEGLKGLQDQNYLKNRYNALMDILQQRSIDREKCIVIFNTYNVDTEKNIVEQIGHLKDKKTIILISHKKSTLKYCDVIYEIKNQVLIKQ